MNASMKIAMAALFAIALVSMPLLAADSDALVAEDGTEYDQDLGEIWSYGYQFYWKGSNASGIQWDFGDGSEVISDDNSDGAIDNDVWNPVHYYEKPGTYYITLTSSNSYDADGTGSGSSTTTVYRLQVNGFPYITYVLDNGQENIVVYQESGESNATAAINVPADPEKAGHTFSGWYTEETCENLYDFESKVTVPVTLYAGWTQNEPVTVSFDVSGGDTPLEPVSVIGGTSYELPAYTGVKEGYTFAGWQVGGQTYLPGQSVTVTSETTATAVWTLNQYTVAFDSAQGSSVESQTVNHGSKAVEPSAPTRTGYTFAGWYLAEDLYDFETPVTGNITLEAQWTINRYTVAFDSAQGSAVASQTVNHGSKAVEPFAPTRTGYTFAGWYLDGSEYDFETPVTAPIELTAQWTINQYTVSFDTDGGSTVPAQTVNHGSKASEPSEPARTGHTFAGWYLDGSEYDFETPVTGNITLEAQWTINRYTVSFDTDGGSDVSPQIVNHGSAAYEPDAPTKTGYTFDGWVLKGVAYDFETPVTSDMELTARWTLNQYTVVFNANGGSDVPSAVVNHGSAVSEPSAPTKTGYTFGGWYLDGEPYDFDAPVTGGIELFAHWTVIVLNVYFDLDGGSGAIQAQKVDYGSAATVPAAPVREGYTFIGWFLGGAHYDFRTPVTSDILLTAGWSANPHTVTFDPNGGEFEYVQIGTVDHGSKVPYPDVPVREGYDFLCWTLNGSEYDFDSPVVEDITLVAVWQVHEYTVSFVTGDGSGVGPQKVVHGGCATVPEDPVREGYHFVGWFIGDTRYDFATPVTSDLELTAQWSDVPIADGEEIIDAYVIAAAFCIVAAIIALLILVQLGFVMWFASVPTIVLLVSATALLWLGGVF